MLEQVLPFLIQRFLHPENVASRQATLTCFAQIFQALEKTEAATTLLAPYKDQLLGAMTTGLKDRSSRDPALAAFQHSVDIPKLFTAEELQFIVHTLNDVTFVHAENDLSWHVQLIAEY